MQVQPKWEKLKLTCCAAAGEAERILRKEQMNRIVGKGAAEIKQRGFEMCELAHIQAGI